MTLKQKGTRAAAAVMVEDFLKSDHKSNANIKEVEEDKETLNRKKRDGDIADWIGRSQKPPSRNEDK